MSKFTKLLAIVSFVATSAVAAPKWVRRATLAAACAASAADAVTTWQGKQIGMIEGNPLLRASDGTPSMGKVISVKVAICSLQAWHQERSKRTSLNTWINIATASGYGAVAWHNKRLTDYHH